MSLKILYIKYLFFLQEMSLVRVHIQEQDSFNKYSLNVIIIYGKFSLFNTH